MQQVTNTNRPSLEMVSEHFFGLVSSRLDQFAILDPNRMEDSGDYLKVALRCDSTLPPRVRYISLTGADPVALMQKLSDLYFETLKHKDPSVQTGANLEFARTNRKAETGW